MTEFRGLIQNSIQNDRVSFELKDLNSVVIWWEALKWG